MTRTTRFGFAAAAALCLFLGGCGPKAGDAGEQPAGIPVTVVHPERRLLVLSRSLNATTVFLSRVTVRAPFQGYINETYKNVGDSVRKGERLFRMQTKEAAAVDTLRLSGSFTRFVDIPSRVDGIVTDVFFHTGDYVADGDQLLRIGEPRSLRIMLNVPYQDMKAIRRGMECRIRIPGGATAKAMVEKIVPAVDPAAQTQPVVLKLSEAASLPENLNLIVEFPVDRIPDAIVLPKKAVLSNETQDEFWIMEVRGDSTAVRVGVTKGAETEGMVEIRSPKLSTTDAVVADGAYGLPDSAKIVVR